MVYSSHYLLVVLIVEGRRFPKRPGQHLILESRFDGELLSTDPVTHAETPAFNSELAWEVSKKLLHQYKLQRTPIKLQCYSIDLQTKQRESIGYILLDLRTASKQDDESPAKLPVRQKWYPLLNSKYSRQKPELLVGLSLEVDAGPKEESFQAKAAPPRKGKKVLTPDTSSESSIDPRFLTPILNNAEGFFQIGPPDRCSDKFILSVTIVFASNLTELVPTTIPLPNREYGFFFFYQLFGNDVTNETFKDLINPNFACERASVHLRSNVEILRAYFMKETKLEIHLCCGEQILGTASIQMDRLLNPPSDVINRRPVSLEGTFPLISPSDTKARKKGDGAAVVGASVVLRRDHIPLPDQQSQIRGNLQEPKKDIPKQEPPLDHEEKERQPPSSRKRGDEDMQTTGAALPLGNQKRVRQGDSDDGTDKEIESIVDDEHIPPKLTDKVSSQRGRKDSNEVDGDEMRQPIRNTRESTHQPSGQPHKTHPPQPHTNTLPETQQPPLPGSICHYGFSIDLRCIRNVNTTTALNIYLRYCYPFFGRSAPIMTYPPVEIMNKHMEVYLPNSFCAFDFATSGQQLHDNLRRVPLMLEVWHRDKETKDLLLGVAEVSLSNVFSSARVPVTTVNPLGRQGWRQICSEKVTARRVSENPTPVADILIALGLEDYGPINTKEVFLSSDSSQKEKQTTKVVPNPPVEEAATAVASPSDPRETMEYKVALELEMWKEQQAEIFENEMKEKELQHLQSLSEEFKRRDKEREMLLKKKLDAYSDLEEQLRFALGDVEKREKELAAKEEEVDRLRDDLQREHESKLTRMQEASERVKEDCIHQIEMEKGKNSMLQEQIDHLTDRVKTLQDTIQQKERDFELYKEQNATKPEMKLQSQISLMNLEKVELERKLDSLTKSKIHYKQQWGRALKELAHLKERQQAEAKARLQKQQQELEHMRLRYLAAEEKEVTKTENQTLEDIKGELQRLKEQELSKKEKQPSPKPVGPPPGGGIVGRGSNPNPEIEERHSSKLLASSSDELVARLIEERDTLLRTGVYSHQDGIIVELDRQIHETLAQSGT